MPELEGLWFDEGRDGALGAGYTVMTGFMLLQFEGI